MAEIDLTSALAMVALSHPGAVRTNNEDAVRLLPELGAVILADGMGGYNAGEVASGMATMLLGDGLEQVFKAQSPSEMDGERLFAEVAIQSQIAKANDLIFQAATTEPTYAGMGTTLVLAVFHDNQVTVAHLGDSRMYRLRNGIFEQVTRDHSLLQEQIEMGLITPEQAKHSLNKNLVTRALGVDDAVQAEIHTYPVLPGDLYLLCSDGLSDMLADEDIADALTMLGVNLELAAAQLVEMANDAGGRDNVSVALVSVKSVYPVNQQPFARLLETLGIKN